MVTIQISHRQACGVHRIVPQRVAGLRAKRTVALVDEQAVLLDVADHQVGKAILVPVARGDSARVTSIIAEGCIGDIVKLASEIPRQLIWLGALTLGRFAGSLTEIKIDSPSRSKSKQATPPPYD